MKQQTLKIFSKKYVQWGSLAILLVFNVFVWAVVLRADRHGELQVAFLDIGQGDAIYIEAPNGNQILIDAGPTSGGTLRALSRVMPFYDHSLDMVLATHPDQDHVGGFPEIIKRMKVSAVMTSENTSDTGAYGAFENMIEEKHLTRILARTGERIILDDGVVLEILFPDRNTRGWETNDASIVARLIYGENSFLLTGDSPELIEKYLIAKGSAKLRADVLKLGHHGSRTSSSSEFLSAVDPDYVIISAGKDNKYGHPHKEVMDLLEKFSIPSFATTDFGDIIFMTDGERLWVSK